MKDGFLRVAAATPKVRVADPQYNAQQIMDLIGQGYSRGVKLMVFPSFALPRIHVRTCLVRRPC